MHRFLTQKHVYMKSAHRVAEMGFTLVEAMVAAVVSSVLFGVVLVIMMMNNNGVKNGAVNSQVQFQYETAIAEIADATRRATAVLADGEAFPPDAGLAAVATWKIEMWYQDAAGSATKIRGFSVEGGVLKEWKPGGGGYQSFRVGSWPAISVLDANPFTLSPSRKTMTVSMRVKSVFSGDTAVAPARGEVFTCRN
jgi:type II secretory pathway pseudopilin PulG